MFCPKCGNPVIEGERFCVNCMEKQATQNTQIIYTEQQFKKNTENNLKEKIMNIFITFSEKQFLRLSLIKILFFSAIIIPMLFLTIITVLIFPKWLYPCVYVVFILLLSLALLLVLIKLRKTQQKFVYVVKQKLKIVIPYTVVLLLFVASVVFFELPPQNQLVGRTFYNKPTSDTTLKIIFTSSDSVRIWIGKYRPSSYSPSGWWLDNETGTTLNCTYSGKTAIRIDNESFFSKVVDGVLTFPMAAKASLYDSESSKLFRDFIHLTYDFEQDSGTTIADNWDYYLRK